MSPGKPGLRVWFCSLQFLAGRKSYRSLVIFRFERIKMAVAFLQNRVKKDGKLRILWEFEVEIEIFEKLSKDSKRGKR